MNSKVAQINLSEVKGNSKGNTLGVIPGYEVIGMGIDATTMELTGLPLIPLDTQQNQQYSCSSNNQYGPGCWQNPFYQQYNYFVSLPAFLLIIADSVERLLGEYS